MNVIPEPLHIASCLPTSQTKLLSLPIPLLYMYMYIATERFSIFRLHCSTTYIDVTCCYRASTVVRLSVRHSHEPKTAVPFETSFGFWTPMVPRNHLLDRGGSKSPCAKRQMRSSAACAVGALSPAGDKCICCCEL